MKPLECLMVHPNLLIIEYGPDGCIAHIDAPPVALNVIASWGGGWDHVSVSVNGNEPRVPGWSEMLLAKRIFFKPDECAVQYHPKDDDYVNVHPFVLHLWRPQDAEIPMPPKEFI